MHKIASLRNPQLDVLRGAAVLLVLGRHLPHTFLPSEPFFYYWQRIGWIGVDLFFVLSGFLVSGLLFADYKTQGRIDFLRFYTRRGFKIYPPFYFFLAASVFLFWGRLDLKRVLTEAFFLQNYLMGVSQIWNHTWSLAIEEHFYLLLGFVFFCLVSRKSARPFRWIPILTAVIALTCFGLRFIQPPRLPVLLCQTHLRMDSLFFGVLLSYGYHFEKDRFSLLVLKWRGPLLLASAFLIYPVFLAEVIGNHFLLTAGLTFLYMAFGAILSVMIVSSADFWGGTVFKPLRVIGYCSYSIYLWHSPVSLFFTEKMAVFNSAHPVFSSFLYALVSLVVGVLLFVCIERPFLRLRDRAGRSLFFRPKPRNKAQSRP